MASSCCFVLRLLKMRTTPATSGSMVIHSTGRSDSEIPYVHHSSRMSSCQDASRHPVQDRLKLRCSRTLALPGVFISSVSLLPGISDLDLQFIVLGLKLLQPRG